MYKAYSDLCAEASRTYLSFLWWLIDPVLSMMVYYVVFGLLLRRGGVDYVPFLLVGLTTWQWFFHTVNHGKASILQNNRLMNLVYVPKVIFPSAVILVDTFKFIIVFLAILIFLLFYGYTIGTSYVALPVVMGVQLVLITAITYFVAALIPFFPDLKFLVENILRLMFFISGIFFDAATIPEKYHIYFFLNPMANIVADYRNILMYNQWPDWRALGIILLFSTMGLFVAFRMIRHFDYEYPRVSIG